MKLKGAEQDKEFTELHLDKGLTLDEIAEKTGYSRTSVSTAIGRYLINGRRVHTNSYEKLYD